MSALRLSFERMMAHSGLALSQRQWASQSTHLATGSHGTVAFGLTSRAGLVSPAGGMTQSNWIPSQTSLPTTCPTTLRPLRAPTAAPLRPTVPRRHSSRCWQRTAAVPWAEGDGPAAADRAGRQCPATPRTAALTSSLSLLGAGIITAAPALKVELNLFGLSNNEFTYHIHEGGD